MPSRLSKRSEPAGLTSQGWKEMRKLSCFAILPLAAGAGGVKKKERVDVFGSTSLGNWTALCLISLTCSEILGWLLSAASHRLGAELRFLRSLGGIAGSASNPFYLILARKALPDLGVNVLHGSELWVSPQPSASGALQQLLCFQLPPPPVSARCVHPEEEFAATRHLSFPSVIAFASPF